MLGNNLNGLLLPGVPDTDADFLPFSVMERYDDLGRCGGDLYVTYHCWLPVADFRFQECDAGVILGVRPSAFERLERSAKERGVNDVAVYPAFSV